MTAPALAVFSDRNQLPYGTDAYWMADDVGKVRFDGRVWFVDFGNIRFPSGKRRVRLYSAAGLGSVGKSRHLADKLLLAVQNALRGGKTIQQAIAPHLPQESGFEGHWGRWVEAKRRRKARRQVGAHRIYELGSYWPRGFFRFFGGISIQDVNTPMLDRWLDWMDVKYPHLARKTVKNMLNDIGCFLRWLEREGDLDRAPHLPDLPLGQLPPVKIPDEETLAAYLGFIPEARRGVFLAMSYNGLRPSEAMPLNVQDYKDGLLTLRHTKTGLPATMPVDWELSEWIDKHVDPRKALLGYWPLFENPRAYSDHRRWTYSSMKRLHEAACRKLGVHFTMYECGRKAAATHALKRSSDIHAVQKLLRHADPRTTERYAKLADQALVKVLRRKE
jgi:integrase